MAGCSRCFGLFVDINNNLYCSQRDSHQVVSKSLNSPANALTIVAGTGCAGSDPNMLNIPYGIFVTINLDLYVADWGNDRIQLFRSGQLNATTVAGNGSTGTISLNRPRGVVLDGDGYLFIVDGNNNRIVGSGPYGFRCLVGCSGLAGAASNQLNIPWALSFDSDGNMFVADRGNNRIQNFLVSNNSCGK
ncbi:RING finger protein nhl-1 [Nosema granulosis]|uniref:RING finger protein nhl-1 n=1 Tax=Nosema granulosis TaxID=83296 RepID=A0A9P6GV71_9MICR|nr:RING finger protein nhl-1 [Nosema granulosis]